MRAGYELMKSVVWVREQDVALIVILSIQRLKKSNNIREMSTVSWLKRASVEISKMTTQSTAITVIRNTENPIINKQSTAVTAIRKIKNSELTVQDTVVTVIRNLTAVTTVVNRHNFEISRFSLGNLMSVTAVPNLKLARVFNSFKYSQINKQSTAKTVIRNLTAVTAVHNLDKIEIFTPSNVSNGSIQTAQILNKRNLQSKNLLQKQKDIAWTIEEEKLIQWFLSAKDLPVSSFQLKEAVQ